MVQSPVGSVARGNAVMSNEPAFARADENPNSMPTSWQARVAVVPKRGRSFRADECGFRSQVAGLLALKAAAASRSRRASRDQGERSQPDFPVSPPRRVGRPKAGTTEMMMTLR